MRRTRKHNQDASISFLDIICCGFGAIVLLLVIVRPSQPVLLEESLIQDKGQVRQLQERLFEIRGQIDYLETELNAKQEQLGKTNKRVAILRAELDQLNSVLASEDDEGSDQTESLEELQIALQVLSKEMKKLLKANQSVNEFVAGIPVDSEYVILVIDSSGSMTTNAWRTLNREVRNILRIYPRLKGIQVMNNEGIYMFPLTRGTFMKDSAKTRRDILQTLQTWAAYSTSTPVGGITAAIREHYDRNRKISIYVLGDDYQGRSIQRVVEAVRDLNKQKANGDTLVRIHGVGFPPLINNASEESSPMRFAALMRSLAEQNNGAFVGLNRAR